MLRRHRARTSINAHTPTRVTLRLPGTLAGSALGTYPYLSALMRPLLTPHVCEFARLVSLRLLWISTVQIKACAHVVSGCRTPPIRLAQRTNQRHAHVMHTPSSQMVRLCLGGTGASRHEGRNLKKKSRGAR